MLKGAELAVMEDLKKWRADETILAGKNNTISYTPTTCSGKNDLYNMQMRCWGVIGYTPDAACTFKFNDY
jgi:hypothetical protein